MTMNGGRIQIAKAFQHLDPTRKLAEGLVPGGFSRIGIKGKVWKLIHEGEQYYFIRKDDGTPSPTLDHRFEVRRHSSRLIHTAMSSQ